MSKKVRRLFDQFQPKSYRVQLDIDPERMTFEGSVIIAGKKSGRPSKRLTFHQNRLNITHATITRQDKKGTQPITVERINTHGSFDEVRLHADTLLYPGEYSIEMRFTGVITETMEGIYPCFYKHDGKDKKLIATQFESHYARSAFPCIDEPQAKATFDLTLITPKGGEVIANTPIRSQKTTGNTAVTVFETTPVMSTYLLAFVFGELHCVEGKSRRGVDVRSWATVAQPLSHLEYANKEAINILDFFEDYFKTPFPLPKLDQVALPDFDALAMENWGLITFREVGLLADPINRSISGERLITQVIAHELSHQWFGNLVTMQWWDDLWLNESFATIMESLAPDKLHPEWHEWEDFTSSRVIGAADRDIYKDVQPVGVRVNHPDEILTLFDPAIVYAKGARILKMLFDFVGEETFSNGLETYFKKYMYKNTQRADLWRELSATSGRDIGALMTPWIEQSGTPELKIKQQGGNLALSQQRFLLDGEDTATLWPIPLLANRPLALDVMEERATTVALSNKAVPIFNPTGSGHFIANYEDKAVQQTLQTAIKDRTLASTGRIIALSDMLLLAKQGSQHLTDMLQLIAACTHEDRDAVWSMFMRVISSAATLTDGNEPIEEQLRHYRREIVTYWYKQLGWDDKPDDDPNIKQLRTTALALRVTGEDPQAIRIALDRFAAAKNVEALPAEQRAIIAGAAVRFGKPAYIQQLTAEYETSHNPDVKDCIAAALCSTRDKAVGKAIIDWGMFNERIIKPQDIDHFFAYLMRNRHTRELAWQWLHDRWPYLAKQFGEGKKMEYFIWYASRPISSPDWQRRYKEFFESMLADVSLKRNIAISFAEIEARVAWRTREESLITAYFARTT